MTDPNRPFRNPVTASLSIGLLAVILFLACWPLWTAVLFLYWMFFVFPGGCR